MKEYFNDLGRARLRINRHHQGFLLDHLRYGINLNYASLVGRDAEHAGTDPFFVFNRDFIDDFTALPEDDRLSVYALLSSGGHSSLWWRDPPPVDILTAYSLIETESTDDYMLYTLFGFGHKGLKAIRKFAKDNFSFYRLKEDGIPGSANLFCYTIKVERQDMFFKMLNMQRVEKAEAWELLMDVR